MISMEYPVGSVQNSVYTALRKSIINLNLIPGSIISEKDISMRYQVSRTPVREAFSRLSQEGLLKVIPQKKTMVSRIDCSRVEQEMFLRFSLENAVMEPFSKKSTPRHFVELEHLTEIQCDALKTHEYLKFLNYDDDFHGIFFEGADETLSWLVLKSMCGPYHRVRLLSTQINDIADDLVNQHRNYYVALQNRNLPQARSILDQHIHKLSNELKSIRERFPEYFTSDYERNSFDVDFGGLTIL